MVFGFGAVYTWLNVSLTFITLRQLSSVVVFWFRAIISLIVTALFIFSILRSRSFFTLYVEAP